jgi:hypothetical protein
LEEIANELAPSADIELVVASAVEKLTILKDNMSTQHKIMPKAALVHYQMSVDSANIIKWTPKLTNKESGILNSGKNAFSKLNLIMEKGLVSKEYINQCICGPERKSLDQR